MMEDNMELTWEVMEKAWNGAVGVMFELDGENPIIDFIAFKMAEKAYRSVTVFPGTSSWEDLESDEKIASAIDRLLADIHKGFPDYWRYCT